MIMDKPNIQQQILNKFNPFIPEFNLIRRVVPFYFQINGEINICERIIKQTGNLNCINFYLNKGKIQKQLKINPEESKLILAKFNYYLLELNSKKEENPNYFGYFSLNSDTTENSFLGVGISLEKNYYGLQFFAIDNETCMFDEISNSSLEKIVQIKNFKK
jgi:hypothetical protein